MKKSLILLLSIFVSLSIGSASLAKPSSTTTIVKPSSTPHITFEGGGRTDFKMSKEKKKKPKSPVSSFTAGNQDAYAKPSSTTTIAKPKPVAETTKTDEKAQALAEKQEEQRSQDNLKISSEPTMQPKDNAQEEQREKEEAEKPVEDSVKLALRIVGKAKEIDEAEKIFIKNLKQEDKRSWSKNGREYKSIKSQGCEDTQIRSIGGGEFICKYGQWLGPIGNQSKLNSRNKDGKAKPKLDDKTMANINAIVAIEWDKYEEYYSDYVDYATSTVSVKGYDGEPWQPEDFSKSKFIAVIQKYLDIRNNLIAGTNSLYDKQKALLYSELEAAKSSADKQYGLAKQLAYEEEDIESRSNALEAADAAYIDAVSDAQSEHETGLEYAEESKQAFRVGYSRLSRFRMDTIFSEDERNRIATHYSLSYSDWYEDMVQEAIEKAKYKHDTTKNSINNIR